MESSLEKLGQTPLTMLHCSCSLWVKFVWFLLFYFIFYSASWDLLPRKFLPSIFVLVPDVKWEIVGFTSQDMPINLRELSTHGASAVLGIFWQGCWAPVFDFHCFWQSFLILQMTLTSQMTFTLVHFGFILFFWSFRRRRGRWLYSFMVKNWKTYIILCKNMFFD